MTPDAWAIHFGHGYRTCTFDRGRAPELAASMHGTVHPMVYLENAMTLDARSERNFAGVHKAVVDVTRRAHEILSERDGGVSFVVTDGLRDETEQASLIKAGASWSMDSKHLPQADGFSHAVDLAATLKGAVRWDWALYHVVAAAMRDAAKEQGVQMRWGGVWDKLLNDLDGDLEDDVEAYVERRRQLGKKARIDGPHFELAEQIHSA
jgi:peptidoglycan L-alanyl-D-glutamate endopeptidase CwlK